MAATMQQVGDHSLFSGVQQANPVEVFQLTKDFNDDTSDQKVNLGVGAYRTDEGKPWVLPVVRTVETTMAADLTLNHEYLPIAGLESYREAAAKLLLGDSSPAISANRVQAVQCLGGTGALRVGLEFLIRHMGRNKVFVSNPTWGNHKLIAKTLGYAEIRDYRHWHQDKRAFDLDGMIEDLEAVKDEGDQWVVLLHMCAHNPTGMDPSPEEWQKIAQVCRERNIFVFFDCAYQGFASGDLDKDAQAVRYFVQEGFELFAAQSFSKNFGLYNERTGNLVVVGRSNLQEVKSQMEIIVRACWSNPPSHGARIVAAVLNNQNYYVEWKHNVQEMALRIIEMRKMLYHKLQALGTPGDWKHINKQNGMFSYTGLSKNQVTYMIKKHHVYLLSSGRINMCALTSYNMDAVAEAIHSAVTNVTDDPKL